MRSILISKYTAFLSLTVISLSTIFIAFNRPNLSFWDESYYIPTAEKYFHRIYFTDVHPPLGKLLIAAGELILKKNTAIDRSHLVQTDKLDGVPSTFSFAGYRLIPSILGMFIPLFLFLFIFELTGKPWFSLFGSLPIAFDSGFILSARGALLDSPQLFFFSWALWIFARIYQRKSSPIHWYYWGMIIAGCALVRINGLILLLLPFSLGIKNFFETKNFSQLRNCFAMGLAGFCMLGFLIYYLHFSLVERIPGTSPPVPYSSISLGKQLILYPGILASQLSRQSEQNQGVPDMNRFSPSENASRAWGWPFGARTIHYRWDKTSSGKVKYLTLILNPATLLIALLGFLWATHLGATRFLHGITAVSRHPFVLSQLWILFFIYMGIMASADRVLYLYHYFPPMIFACLLFALLYEQYFEKSKIRNPLILTISITVILGFIYYLPFIYHLPITSLDVVRRSWFEFWELRPIL